MHDYIVKSKHMYVSLKFLKAKFLLCSFTLTPGFPFSPCSLPKKLPFGLNTKVEPGSPLNKEFHFIA